MLAENKNNFFALESPTKITATWRTKQHPHQNTTANNAVSALPVPKKTLPLSSQEKPLQEDLIQ